MKKLAKSDSFTFDDDSLPLKSKILQILTHVLAWAIFMAMLIYLVPKPGHIGSYSFFLIPNALIISFYYLNYYWLVPRFFIRRRYLIYGLICFGALVLTTVVPTLLFDAAPRSPEFHGAMPPDMFRGMPPAAPPHGPEPDMHGDFGPLRLISPDLSYAFFVFALVLLLSLGLRIKRLWQQAEKERVNAELAFLKAQINPHFLFNTLNNIHSMVINQSDKTPEAIEVFSDLLRFVIYETRNETVSLISKLQYIRDYLTLQQMRLPENVSVNFMVEGNPNSCQIAPMILMPFIENAFKYGVSTEEPAVIDIRIEIRDPELVFQVKNTKFRRSGQARSESQLGLGNTMKRLNLIYPGRHKLSISETDTEYRVLLQIMLK